MKLTRWRRLAWAVFATFATLALLLAVAIWLVSSNAGLRWLADTASGLSRGQLLIEGVEGRLDASIGIEKLVITSTTQRITLQRIRLQWQPRALLRRQLDIDLLAMQSVRIEVLREDPTPLSLPATLRFPLAINIAAWEVTRLERVQFGQTLVFDSLHGKLDGLGDSYRLEADATSPWAKLSGKFEIGKDAPFELTGRVIGERREATPAQATLQLSGPLAAIRFQVDADAESMQFMATGEVAPFAAVRVNKLLMTGEGIDPRRLVAGAPHADLAFSGVFEGKLDAEHGDERLFGTFSLSNRLAGRIDQDRLPIANLSGAVLGDAASADFSALSIDLGAGGHFSGEGEWRDGRFRVELNSARLNLAELQRDLHATRLRIALVLAGDTARQNLTADVSESWGKGHFSMTHADGLLRLESANFSGQAGRLNASGELKLDTGRAFIAQFNAGNINPARIGKFPRARLNAIGEINGELAPTPRFNMRFSLPTGELDGRPVSGHGRLSYADRRLTGTDIALDLAGNRGRLKGDFGRVGDRIEWEIDAPALARLHSKLAGRLRGSGSIDGDPSMLRIDALLQAGGLRLPGDIAADSVDLRLNLQTSPQGAFDGRLQARGIKLSGRHLDSVDATLRGRRDAHELDISARLPDWRLEASLAGGLDAAQIWRGQLRTAEVQGAWPLRLLAPATLELSREQQRVDDLSLTLAGGRVNLAHLLRTDALLETRGNLSNLPLAPLLGWLKKPPPLHTDLRLNGDWNLRLAHGLKAGLESSLEGEARLWRHSGDVRLLEPAIQLGLTNLALNLRAEAGQIDAKLEVDTREAGQVRAEGRAQLLRTSEGFSVSRTAPLAWTANIDVPDLRLARSFVPLGMRADARIIAQLEGRGSLAAPRLTGQINASRIRYTMPEEGIAITDGSLKLSLENDRVRVLQGELKGQSGRIIVSGEALLTQPQAGLTLTFEKFAASNRSDRRIIVSGVTLLKLDQNKLHLTGELRADRARLEMQEASRPTLSSDVVIIGRPPQSQKAALRLPLTLDLKLDLGSDFLFKGAGIDARLGGQLRVFTQNQVLRGEGSIQVVKGRYAAYAQSLDIERGVLRFSGPLDNPGIDVLAVRKMPTVKAGVQVGGSVQRPLVTLYSDPPMPDTEKLSWLVLGQGLDNAGQQEFVLLQIATSALLSQADSVNLQANLAEALRIDSFALRAGTGDDLGSSVISVGKRLSSRTTLSYDQSLDGLNQVVKVLYQLTPHIRLEAQTGLQSSFDAFYSLEFD